MVNDSSVMYAANHFYKDAILQDIFTYIVARSRTGAIYVVSAYMRLYLVFVCRIMFINSFLFFCNSAIIEGKGYIRHSDLVTHQRFHNKEKPFGCPHCSKGFCQRG